MALSAMVVLQSRKEKSQFVNLRSNVMSALMAR